MESWYGEEVEGLNQKSDCKISNNNSGNGYLNLNKNIAKISENKCREIGDTNSQMNGSTIIDRNIADNSYK